MALEAIVSDLREVLQFEEGGIRPRRSCGTWWVSHKLSAMKRVLCKYGAYKAHLSTLSQNQSMTPATELSTSGVSH